MGDSARRPAWVLFLGLALTIVVVDRLSKAWVMASIEPGTAIRLIGDTLRLIYSRNDGALFGLLGSAAPVMAVVSLGVIGLIVWYHARSGRSLLLSAALGLLLGGAIGNLIDRIQLGYVVDWVDMGIGTLRFWTYNVGDAAITCAILLLLLIALKSGTGTPADDA
jgi:signal peptidase II